MAASLVHASSLHASRDYWSGLVYNKSIPLKLQAASACKCRFNQHLQTRATSVWCGTPPVADEPVHAGCTLQGACRCQSLCGQSAWHLQQQAQPRRACSAAAAGSQPQPSRLRKSILLRHPSIIAVQLLGPRRQPRVLLHVHVHLVAGVCSCPIQSTATM